MTTIIVDSGAYTVSAGVTLNFTDEPAFELRGSWWDPSPWLVVRGTVNVSFTSPPGAASVNAVFSDAFNPYTQAIYIEPTGVFNVVSTLPGVGVVGYLGDGNFAPAFINRGIFSVTGLGDAYGLSTTERMADYYNWGHVQVLSSGGLAHGYEISNGGNLHNSGDIEASGATGAVAVSIGWLTNAIDNTGTIRAFSAASGAAVAVSWSVGDSLYGFTNSGRIEGDVALQASVYLAHNPINYANSGVMIGAVQLTSMTDNFTNTGAMTGDISFGDGRDTFTSSGTVKGSIDLGLADDTMTNSGLIDGSVNLGDGADVLNIKAGSKITGLIDGGPGSDTVTFDTARAGFAVHTAMDIGGFVTTLADSTGADGTAKVSNVETFSFNGASFGFAGIQQNHEQNLDGGRYDDVLFQRASTGAIYYQDMNGSITPGGFQNVLGGLPVGWKAVGAADISGDGRADALIQDTNTGSLYYIYQAGRGTDWCVITQDITSSWKYVGAGDLNRDGNVDVVFQDSTTGWVVYRDIAHSSWGSVASIGTGWKAVGVGDFNHDGYSDVALQNQADGTVYYANMAGGALSGWGSVAGPVGASWKVVGVGDLTGDGYSDVVFQNNAAGQVWCVDMHGGANNGWGVVANGLSGWTVRDVADVNNDGYADVVIQNNTDGTAYYADLHGGAFLSWGAVSGALGSDWVVV